MNCNNCGKTVFVKETCTCGEIAPNKNRGGVIVNNILCIAVLVGAVLALILSVSLRYIVNNDLLAETVRNAELTQIEVKDDSGETVPLDEWVYKKYIDDDRITVKNVDNVLNNPFIKDFLVEKIHGIQDFLMDDGDIVTITSDDIIELIDKNSDLLYNEAGLNFLEPDKDELRNNLSGLDDLAKFSEEHFSGWLSSSFVQTPFSLAYVIFLTVLLGIILAQLLLVYYFNGRRMLKALKVYGIAMTAPASVVFVLTLIPLIVFYSSSAFEGLSLGKLFAPFCVSSGILLVIGVIMLVGSVIAAKLIEEKAETVADTVETAGENADMTDISENAAETFSAEEFAPVSGFAEPVKEETVPEANAENKTENTLWNAEDKNSVWAKPAEKTSDIKPTAEERPKKEFVFCTKCGKQNRAGSRFCSGCGNKLRNR